MPKRKSIALYRRNLLNTLKGEEPSEQWLYSFSEFDINGNLLEQSIYSQDGTLVEKTVNEYDEKSYLVREKYFTDAGEAAEEKSYERNENGLIIKEIKHYSDGSCDTCTYNYDSQHRILSKVIINDEGEEELRMENEYRNDFLTKTQVFDGEGNLIQSDEFNYDEKGNTVEHRRIDNESGIDSFVVTEYNSSGRKKEETSFDEDGDVINQTFYTEDEKGNLLEIKEEGTERNVLIRFTYDENGNAIKQEEIDSNGKQLVSVVREYDNHNNLIRSEVFIDGRGMTLPQHYEIRFDYSFYDD